MTSTTNQSAPTTSDWSRPRHLDGLNWPSEDREANQLARYRFRGSSDLCERIGDEVSDAYQAGDWDAHPPLTIEIDVAADDQEAASISLTWELAGNSAAADTYEAYELIRIHLSRYYLGWLEKLEPDSIEVGRL
jgi:hypothetical protein